MLVARQSSVQILTSLPNIQISHFGDLGVLYVDWISFQTAESIAHGCELVLHQLRITGSSRLLNDNTRVSGPWDAGIPYLVTDFFPQLRELPMQRMAWSMSSSLFSQFSAQKTMGLLPAEQQGHYRLFHTFDEAYRWLVQS